MKRYALLLSIPCLVGCHAVLGPVVALKPDYSELPMDALRDVAQEIEQAVQNQDRDAEIRDRGGIVVSDERVRQAIRTRAARSQLVNELLDSGFAWEKRNGHLYLLTNSAYKKATTRRGRDMNALVVSEEAGNRWAIYEGIIRSSNLSPRALAAIEEVFHEARVATMRPGQKYEDADGNAVRK